MISVTDALMRRRFSFLILKMIFKGFNELFLKGFSRFLSLARFSSCFCCLHLVSFWIVRIVCYEGLNESQK